MKVPVLSSLILLLGLSSNLPAIERPKDLDADGPKEHPGERVREPEAIPQVKPQAAGAWLGVLSEPADEVLGLHLGLDGGVVLSFVAKDSPAANAGLARHDILTRLDGAAIGNQDELRGAVQNHQPGDEVTLSIVRKGKAEERKVVLGARPANLPAVPQAPRMQRLEKMPKPKGLDGLKLEGFKLENFKFEDLKELNLDDLKGLKDLPGMEELEKRFPELKNGLEGLKDLLPEGGGDLQNQLEGQMKQLELQLRGLQKGGGLQLDLNDMLDDLKKPNQGGFNFNFKSSSSFKFFDDEGSVEMKTTEGGKEVVVRDKAGKLLFEGPWDTPQDKAAAPDDIRQRIEKMNNGNKFHFRMENLPEPKMELPDVEERELE